MDARNQEHELLQEKIQLINQQINSYNSNPLTKQQKEQFYEKSVKVLVGELNESNSSPSENLELIREAQKAILSTLSKLDDYYVKSLAKENTSKTIMFTRHGRCSDLQKGLGLNPNANVDEEAIHIMEQNVPSIISGMIGDNENKITIAISPLLRALQTAEAIFPENIKDIVETVYVNPWISETSSAPSGKDIRIGTAAIMRANVVEKLKSQLENEFTDTAFSVSVDEGDKILKIQQFIDTCKPGNLMWFIGHGKIFKSFFKDMFGVESNDDMEFGFAETKKFYLFKDQVHDKLIGYLPPYKLSINQNTGLFEAKKTKSKLFHERSIDAVNNVSSTQSIPEATITSTTTTITTSAPVVTTPPPITVMTTTPSAPPRPTSAYPTNTTTTIAPPSLVTPPTTTMQPPPASNTKTGKAWVTGLKLQGIYPELAAPASKPGEKEQQKEKKPDSPGRNNT